MATLYFVLAVGVSGDQEVASTEQADDLLEHLFRLPEGALPKWLELIDALDPIQQGERVP